MDDTRGSLCRELEDEGIRLQSLGRRYHRAAFVLQIAGLLGSITAGALGLFAGLASWIIGLIALVPTATTLIARQLKLQGRANYYYRFSADLRAIRSRARFSDHEGDSTGALAWEASELRKLMAKEFADLFGADVAEGAGKHG